jgi:uncharacterized DUF497 family protein
MGDAERDPRRAAANVKKHGVDFADAATQQHAASPFGPLLRF